MPFCTSRTIKGTQLKMATQPLSANIKLAQRAVQEPDATKAPSIFSTLNFIYCRLHISCCQCKIPCDNCVALAQEVKENCCGWTDQSPGQAMSYFTLCRSSRVHHALMRYAETMLSDENLHKSL